MSRDRSSGRTAKPMVNQDEPPADHVRSEAEIVCGEVCARGWPLKKQRLKEKIAASSEVISALSYGGETSTRSQPTMFSRAGRETRSRNLRARQSPDLGRSVPGSERRVHGINVERDVHGLPRTRAGGSERGHPFLVESFRGHHSDLCSRAK